MSTLNLDGKVAVVTGAGRGLGASIAIALASEGVHVLAVSRTLSDLEETASKVAELGPPLQMLVADLSDLHNLGSFSDLLWNTRGRIDIVIHAAGRQIRKPAIEISPDELRAILDLNLAAPLLLSSAIGKRMIDNEIRGRHIFIGSLASKIGLPNIVPYTASKSGVLGVVHGLSREWASHGITVNAVLPGYFDTALTRDLLSDPSQLNRVMSRIPMGHLGQPEDVAAACLFFASELAKYVTGEALAVDGGWLAS